MEYWKECIEIAFEEEGIKATEEQIINVAESVQGAHENYSMYHGYDVISKGAESEAEKELRELKQKLEKEEKWERSTKPCKTCTTTGIVQDGWGRDVVCYDCNGKGRNIHT